MSATLKNETTADVFLWILQIFPEAYSEPYQTSKMEIFAKITAENRYLFSQKAPF